MAQTKSARIRSPHASLKLRRGSERMLANILDALWNRHRERMPHIRAYEEVLLEHGATFWNDHVAFRTLATQSPGTGVASVTRPFEALGYRAAGCYDFPDKHLGALHLRHAHPRLPKIFVSELRTWELSAGARRIVARTLAEMKGPLSDRRLAALHRADDLGERDRTRLSREVVRFFEDLPWEVPRRADVIALDRETQYGAWVLLHGYGVNHFTASIDSHGVSTLDDIEKTVAALRKARVPMKPRIEGKRGSRLRQSSTQAVTLDMPVRQGGRVGSLPWTYAYFELAERPRFRDPASGKQVRFEGFLGGQATHLFDMTKRR